jgi:hypothetical protein
MRFKNLLLGGPFLGRFATRGAEETIAPTLAVANTGITRAGQSAALGPRLEIAHRSEADDRLRSRHGGIRVSSGRNPSWRPILAERFRAVMRAIVGFAAHGEAAFESVLLAAMSWTVTQVLAGCAEYCHAAYPISVEPNGPVDSDDATDRLHRNRSVADQPGSREIAAPGTKTQSHQARLGATCIVHAEAVLLGDHCE